MARHRFAAGRLVSASPRMHYFYGYEQE
ncbi:MAG: hypothetical protein JWP27_662, partial [Flaviaesturariibacter sp.]|nr:hypothetical protein [Flaviaesturariibacter sp.]